jgi:glycosyltransferase involved in cell wall biosynthesis
MLKLAFVIHRYGAGIIGGATMSCRSLAHRLSKYFEITVLTTCAEDYLTWENSYDPGESRDGPVVVRRFRTDHPRSAAEFNKLTETVFRSSHETWLEEEWIRSTGPYSSDLIDYVSKTKSDYDLFVFFTYAFATTYFGMQKVTNRSVLVPSAHDEPAIYLGIFGKVFEKATGLIYKSPEEKAFIESRFDVTGIPSAVLGNGFDAPEPHGESELTIDYPFLVYVGRLDEGKGCVELIEYFRRYKNERKTDTKLLLVGPNIMNARPSGDILVMGVLSEQQKSELIRRALLLVNPSRFESFSRSIFEAWLESRPVLVNASSEAMKGHCIRSNGGLYYSNYEEFKRCLDDLVSNRSLRDALGSQGRKYVLSNYSWPRVEEEYRKFLTQVAGKVSGLT